MATNDRRQTAFRVALLAITLTVAAGGVVAFSGGSAAADVKLDSLDVADANKTVTSDVSDVTLSATLSYDHSVPDADRRQVKLKAGPSKDNLELVDYQQARDPSGTASGTVELSGSLVELSGFSAEDFNPALAETSSQEIVVQAVIEVQRAGGDPVIHTVTDTATVTVQEGTELSAEIGGDGSIQIETSG
jgi:hypothetical protein